jgi:hypothetical protein
MRRTIACLPALFALATVACSTDRVPIDGIVVSTSRQADVPSGYITVTHLLTTPAGQRLRIRLNGKYMVWEGPPGDFQYVELAGFGNEVGTIMPSGPYVVELVDPSGSVWATSASITVHSVPDATWPFVFYSSVAFLGAPGHIVSKNVEPLPDDGDPATAEITVMNAIDQPVAVDLCDVRVQSSACASIATVAPGDEFRTVQAIVAGSPEVGRSLRVRTAAARSPYYVGLSTPFTSCQVQELFVVGEREIIDPQTGQSGAYTSLAASSCLQ